MKKLVYILSFMLISISTVFAQINREKELIQLSNDKWQWMSEKNVEKLEKLFDDKAKFVHMSGTWKKTKNWIL